MSKNYTVRVKFRQTMDISVNAGDEVTARRQARDIVSKQFSGATIDKVDIVEVCENQLQPGSRINHAVFGPGVILDTSVVTNAAGERGFRATVEFENGTTKELRLPHPSVTVEH